MTATLNSAQQAAIEWLKQEFVKRHLLVKVYDQMAHAYSRVVVVPVALWGDANQPEKVFDAHDIASALQEVEDAWNYQEPDTEAPLLLKPAARPRTDNVSEDEALSKVNQ